ncbi:MAG: RNA polymerase sigma factor RpoD/SigA [Armatimonadetes bacterium]|nr:RNA polymerase sigma factor RpoD/SigA [Armatimonadota bacterium]
MPNSLPPEVDHERSESAFVDDAMAAWMRQATRLPLLSPKAERALLERWAKGDTRARERLVEANLRLVFSVARKYIRPGISLSDLVQEGTIGLIRAIDKFDATRNVRLSTYAVWWIRHSIERFILDKGSVIRLPAHIAGQVQKISKAADRLRREAGKDPSFKEVAEVTGLSEVVVENASSLDRQPLSLDQLVSDEQETRLSELVADSETPTATEVIERVSLQQDVHTALLELDPREREIMILRFGLDGQPPRTLREVGGHVGLTSERVRQIERVAAQKLRRKGLPAAA